ncbi:aspartyl/asparaginyl beta-hydroxylase domain-containing protein [Kitasatospora sp. NPDC096077]|uniref:aspartyl/asparaginyl beta-hydroxylase domain-containing protein n=1 Tax=Kitasatospora sp. NPDC096077 TaxID=3155544 RepID=UPI0033165510
MTEATQAHVVPGLPAAARLALDFDVERLVADVAELRRQAWKLQATYGADGVIGEAPIDWRVLPLRSPGGALDRTDPGGPALEDFEPTEWLAKAPYLAEVLDTIPAELRSARLMALGPGARSADHFDNKYGVAWGTARVHVPILTHAEARMYIADELQQWQPGTFWFGDFSRVHRVENTGTETRVHLVIDTLPSKELFELFPAEVRDQVDGAEIVFSRGRQPLTAEAAAASLVAFDLPESFANWEETEGEFLQPQKQLAAVIERDGEHLVLSLDGRPEFRLVHVGDQEFRFAGWTEERTVQVLPGDAPRVVLRTRVGSRVQQLELAARRG